MCTYKGNRPDSQQLIEAAQQQTEDLLFDARIRAATAHVRVRLDPRTPELEPLTTAARSRFPQPSFWLSHRAHDSAEGL